MGTDEKSVLQEAHALIHGNRRESYGHPLDDYTRTAGMFNARFAHKIKEPFTAEELMQTMILVKLSRLAASPNHRDCLVDGAGYFGCIEAAQKEREKRAKNE